MIIGAHVPTAGGLKTAIDKGLEIGAEALQIFPSAPLQWKIRGWDEAQCQWFKAEWPRHFQKVVFHGIYLTNLAAQSPDNLAKSKTALIETLRLAPKIGVVGTIFHPGNYTAGAIVAKAQIAAAIKEIQAETPKEAWLVYENSAGGTMGGKLEDLAWLLEVTSDKSRVAICLDTCHAFAAGYDISNQTGYEKYLTEVDRLVGLERVFSWHFNDSKFGLGERRDRHENIGEGKLGRAPFSLIINDKRWVKTASYLEVPGFDGSGPDKKNIDILKGLRQH